MLRPAALLLALLGYLSTVAGQVEPLVDLGDSAVTAPKRRLGEQLGEALKAKAKFNANCVGAAMPACQRGKVNMVACKCACPWNYQGNSCETCNMASCKNGGSMTNAKDCKCKCQPGFSGPNCMQGSKCLNGGTNPGQDKAGNNPQQGTCKCANGWTGGTCLDCHLKCKHGSSANMQQCKCNCPANRKPPFCDGCQDPGCLNGGVFVQGKDKKTDLEQCGCHCPIQKAYTGVRCEICKNPGCVNGAKWNQNACQCACSHKDWGGAKCEKCNLHCSDGKNLDPKTCTCVDGAQVSYNPCKTGCRHGVLDTKKCTCKCKPGFKGMFCDQCVITSCMNQGKLRVEGPDADCKCECQPPWKGDTCNKCPTQCGPNGVVKAGCAGCSCKSSKTGKFIGNKCEKCSHAKCLNGGTLDETACECKCTPGYGGPACGQCILSPKMCKNGATLKKGKCECNCLAGKAGAGDWTGQLCEKCTHRGCKNGGNINKETCSCECVPVWRGRYCAACGHPLCGILAVGAPSLGNNGFKDKRPEKVCAWAADQLGCPGPGTAA